MALTLQQWKQLYAHNRSMAKKRNIEWQFTLEEYICRWQDYINPDGSRSPYVLCRIQEPGPYSFDNTRIGTQLDNGRDASRNGRLRSNQYDCIVNGKQFESLAEASRYYEIQYDTFLVIANRKQPTQYKGQHFHIHKGNRKMKPSLTNKY